MAEKPTDGTDSAAKLFQAEARYRALVEQLPAVTFMAALNEGINEIYVSPQIEKLLGFTQREWLDDPILWYRQLHPDDQARWHTEFARTCATDAISAPSIAFWRAMAALSGSTARPRSARPRRPTALPARHRL